MGGYLGIINLIWSSICYQVSPDRLYFVLFFCAHLLLNMLRVLCHLTTVVIIWLGPSRRQQRHVDITCPDKYPEDENGQLFDLCRLRVLLEPIDLLDNYCNV
jgi:hypothetical protein